MKAAFRLSHAAPYDWDGLLAFLAARAIPGIETVADGAYARTFLAGGRHGIVTVRPGRGAALSATVDHPDPAAAPAAAARLRLLFDLDSEPAAIAAGLSRDPRLAALVAARPGLRVPGAWDGLELAARAVLGQQVSVAAATRLAGRLAAAFGAPLDRAGPPGLTRVFPSAERLAEADVAAALGMPRARGAAISGLAAASLADPGLFAPGRGLDAAVARLKALPGIGEWTAQYIALRALREPDALPAGDIGLMRVLDRGEGRPSPAQLLARSQAWRPWRAYAAMHLWASEAGSPGVS